ALVARLGAERREVAARVGLRVALAPHLLTAVDLRQEAPLLRLDSELDHQQVDHAQPEGAELPGPGVIELLAEDEARRGIPAGAAVLLGPVRRDPSLRVEDAVPLHDLVHGEVAVDRGLRGQVRRERFGDPAPHFLAERLLGGGEGQVHLVHRHSLTGRSVGGGSPYHAPARTSTPQLLLEIATSASTLRHGRARRSGACAGWPSRSAR